MYKLPIKEILKDAFLIPWKEKALFASTLAPSVLTLVCAWAIWTIAKPESVLLNYLYFMVYLYAFCYFAITCHRLILRKNEANNSYNTIRIVLFIKWFLIIYGISLLIEVIILTAVMIFFDSFNYKNINYINVIMYLPFMYFAGRLSLMFPATALDLKGSLKWSWNETKNNGLNILLVVGIFPWLMHIILLYTSRDNPSVIEKLIHALLTYTASAIGIFALSLTYKSLQINAQKKL